MTDSCSKITGFCLLAISVLMIIISGVNFLNSKSYDEGTCIITNVTYPQSITDSANLITCDCGRRCTSDAGTCIRITGILLKTPEIQNRYFVSNTDVNHPREDCTFAETRCTQGEKVEDRLVAVENAKQKAREYISYQNDKKEIPCYHRNGDNHLYLKNEDVSLFFYISCGCVILSICCLCCCLCRCCTSTQESEFV